MRKSLEVARMVKDSKGRDGLGKEGKEDSKIAD